MNKWIHAGHVLRALKKHQFIVFILVLQTALSFAVICNVAFMASQRYAARKHATSLQESGLGVLDVSQIDASGHATWAQTLSALQLVQGIGGITGASATMSMPLNQAEMTEDVSLHAGSPGDSSLSTVIYAFPDGFMKTLGIQVASGRGFLPEEYVNPAAATPAPASTSATPLPPAAQQNPSVVILSRQLAGKLFGNADALGKTVYLDGSPATVVGIVKTLLSPFPTLGADNEMTAIVPAAPSDSSELSFIIRADPHDLDHELAAAKAALHQQYPGWIISGVQSYASLKARYYQHDSAMLKLMIASLLAVIVVLMVGIAGLVGFWVSKRSKTVGIRRALGAPAGAITAMFLFENLVVVLFGLAVGVVAAIVLNAYLIRNFGESPITPVYFLIAAVVLLAASQIACFAPSRRASRVPPVSAMRNS